MCITVVLCGVGQCLDEDVFICSDVYLHSLQYNNIHYTILMYTERYHLKDNIFIFKIHINNVRSPYI